MKNLFLILVAILIAFACSEDIYLHDGLDGEQGIPGKDGRDGKDGFSPLEFIDSTGTIYVYFDIDLTGTFTPKDSIISVRKEDYKFIQLENPGCFAFVKILNGIEIPLDTICGLQGPRGNPGQDGKPDTILIINSDTLYVFGKDTLYLAEFQKPSRVILDIIYVDISECKSGEQVVWKSFQGDSLSSEIYFCVPADGETGPQGPKGETDTIFINKIVTQIDSVIFVFENNHYFYDTITLVKVDSVFITQKDTVIKICFFPIISFIEQFNDGDTHDYESLKWILQKAGFSINHNGSENGNGSMEAYSPQDTAWTYEFSPRNIYNLELPSGSRISRTIELFAKDIYGNIFTIGEKTISATSDFIWWNKDSYKDFNKFVYNESNLLNPKLQNIVRIGFYVKNPKDFLGYENQRNYVLNFDYLVINEF